MRRDTPLTPKHLADYAPPAWLVETVALTFRLAPEKTEVDTRIEFRRNPAVSGTHPFVLDGEELTLKSARIDGADVLSKLTLSETGLTLDHALPDQFIWEASVEISTLTNTALEGLYMSKDMYCTQCEAEGFRKITYYPDRPDVMAVFTVRIEGSAPVLLSNGNLIGSGPGWAEWHDPWPKPAYLFALVAGDLVAVEDQFTTVGNRKVDLRIYVRPGDENKCDYAMDALKRSMAWDEQAYGRAYDLDLFMIVAVDDFNMGAMENKGLNIFNSKYVLATPETATDLIYERIEGIIAHEYFHNWTGNRITCRDWFQLCLKEGLTVFRDQQFSGDMRSHAVKRIDDVKILRARQFREDAGPLSHPVRPQSYIEINNFYTATIYEKGAELIRMLYLMLGAETYRKGTDLYFERHDGQAATIEDWLTVFEDVSGQDLTQFARWYAQAGTPVLSAKDSYADGVYTLHLHQQTLPTPDQPQKAPVPIPVAYGLIAADGQEVAAGLHILRDTEDTLQFELPERPVASLLRGLSAPVTLRMARAEGELAHLLAHDTDPLNRWEAARSMALEAISAGQSAHAALTQGLRAVLLDDRLDPAFRAFAIALPGEEDCAAHLAGLGQAVDPAALYRTRRGLHRSVGQALQSDLVEIFHQMATPGPYSPDAAAAGRRALRLEALSYLTAIAPQEELAEKVFASADNMTESLRALALLVRADRADTALKTFETRWQDDENVMDSWFSVQAAGSPPERAVEVVSALTRHPQFHWKNPNRARSVLGSFTQNAAGFNRADGAGYRLLADWLLKLDPVNPQLTARLAGAFETWRRLETGRQALVGAELERIAAAPDLSRDTSEIIGRMRAG